MTKGHFALCSWGSGGAVSPNGSREEPRWGSRGRSPQKILKCCILLYLDEAKKHPVYPCTEYKVRRKTRQVQKPMRKGKVVQHVFITLGKLKLQINFQISLHAQGPMPKKIDQRFFSRTSKFRNSHNLHEIDKKSDMKSQEASNDSSDLCSFKVTPITF